MLHLCPLIALTPVLSTEAARRKEEGGRFNIFKVIVRTIYVATGIRMIISMIRKKPAEKDEEATYVEVNKGERAASEDEPRRRSSDAGTGSRPHSPSPVIKESSAVGEREIKSTV